MTFVFRGKLREKRVKTSRYPTDHQPAGHVRSLVDKCPLLVVEVPRCRAFVEELLDKTSRK